MCVKEHQPLVNHCCSTCCKAGDFGKTLNPIYNKPYAVRVAQTDSVSQVLMTTALAVATTAPDALHKTQEAGIYS